MENKFILGLDLGVGSVGWALMLLDELGNPCRILDLGSRIFEPEGSSMEERRIARGTRRNLRRRGGRVKNTRNLFVKYEYLTPQQINQIYCQKGIIAPDVYELRLKGKYDLLTYEELLMILVHYAKGRGFKSNRKIQDANAKENGNDDQKMLAAKKKTEELLKSKKAENPSYTITNLLVENREIIHHIRNNSEAYQYGITRAMIEEETDIILNKQFELGLINEDFIHEYKEIVFFQRNFADGPDYGPYHNPLEQMIGSCTFIKEEPRVAKGDLTVELFTLVQKLTNIVYKKKTDKKTKYKLDKNVIQELVRQALDNKEIKYKSILKLIGTDYYFPDLSVSRKEYLDLVEKARNDSSKSLEQLVEEKKLNTKIYKLQNYVTIKNGLKNILGENPNLTNQQYDLIGECLSRNKSDIEIKKFLNEPESRAVLKEVDLPDEVKEAVCNLEDKDFTQFASVSLKYLYQVLPLMINEGLDYYEASKACGFDTQNILYSREKIDYIPVIDKVLEELGQTINNKSVVRTLVETRKIVNAIVKKYGKPVAIHVEMARELTKSDDERKEIENVNNENQAINSSLRQQIYAKYPNKFASIDKISGADVLQYKLFIEQNFMCPYTLAVTGDIAKAKIHESELFSPDLEIDHIVPYSLTHDDRMTNKILVRTEYNRIKSQDIPGHYYDGEKGIETYINYVKTNYRFSADKRERLLANEITDKFINDYQARTLNDTRYATKALKKILTYTYGEEIPIRVFTGQITAKLRGVWGLNGLTHSYESKTYRLPKQNVTNDELKDKYNELSALIEKGVSKKSKEYRECVFAIKKLAEDKDKKNRENHLHHALDAVIIAVATDKVRTKIQQFEILKRNTNFDHDLVEYLQVIDNDTGEVKINRVVKPLEEFYQSLNIQTEEDKKHYPLPYDNFSKEVILRTYERDENILQWSLMQLDNYTNVNIQEIHPLMVSHHYSSKLSGRFHQATMMGAKQAEEGLVKVSRMSITDEKFDSKKLEKIYDKEGTQNYVYKAVKEWLGTYKNGATAYVEHGKQLPQNKNGNPIKKVKLNEGLIKEEFEIKAGSGQYVQKDDVVQIHVYTRDNDDKLYFVGMDRFRILNIEKREDLNLVFWYGQGKNNISLNYSQLKENGFIKQPQIFYKGQYVEIEMKNGAKELALINGCTSGYLEVKSVLGDAIDLIHNGLFQSFRSQYNLTVSTIKSIKPISISVLGKFK